jgi:hypothetical protein
VQCINLETKIPTEVIKLVTILCREVYAEMSDQMNKSVFRTEEAKPGTSLTYKYRFSVSFSMAVDIMGGEYKE